LLAHVKNTGFGSNSNHYGIEAEEIGLEGIYVVEWNPFIKGLNHCGIRLTKMEDEIVWPGTLLQDMLLLGWHKKKFIHLWGKNYFE